MENFLGLPTDLSARGAEIDSLMGWLHLLMIILFVGWGLFFVYTLFRFSARRNPKADYTGVKNHYTTYLETVVVIAEVILLMGFSIPIWANVVAEFPAEKDAIVVRVVAEQFAWNFHYAGPDGKFGNVDVKHIDSVNNPLGIDPKDENGKDDYSTINQMYVPTGKPIIAKLSSKDVIHSFGVPFLRVKQDAIPGMEVPIWFEALKTGTAEIACSQLCGVGHYSMRGFVNIKSPEDFAKWQEEQTKAKAEENAGSGGDDFWN
jgi:cytochrome c oxidase subunit II